MIFISYSREQFYWAESITLALQERGADVWFDLQHLLPGTDWERDIQQSLESCSELLLIVSRTALRSEYVDREWRDALVAGKRIVIALVEVVKLPPELQDPAISIVDCRTDFERGIKLLAECLMQDTIHRDTLPSTRRFPRDIVVVSHSVL